MSQTKQSTEEYKQKERERARLNRQKQKERRTRTEEDVRTEDVSTRTLRTRTEEDEDDELPPEMETIAGKYEPSPPTAPPVEEEEDREKALLRDEVDQLRDAIKKLQQFPKASELQAVAVAAKVQEPKEEEDLNTVVLKERIVLIEKDLTKARDLLMRQLMQLKGRGWHIVELSARYIS